MLLDHLGLKLLPAAVWSMVMFATAHSHTFSFFIALNLGIDKCLLDRFILNKYPIIEDLGKQRGQIIRDFIILVDSYDYWNTTLKENLANFLRVTCWNECQLDSISLLLSVLDILKINFENLLQIFSWFTDMSFPTIFKVKEKLVFESLIIAMTRNMKDSWRKRED